MPAVVNCSGKNRKSELRLLLAEDDPDLSLRLKRYLGKQGFAVDAVHNGVDAEFNGREMPYDAIVLDLGLPQRSGLEVLANWRKAEVKTPVLILTARDSWQEKVQGLQQGADDYLTKPFQEEELLARLQALIRRNTGTVGKTLTVDGWVLDEETQSVSFDAGVFSVLLGSTEPISPSLFDGGRRWISVSVAGGAELPLDLGLVVLEDELRGAQVGDQPGRHGDALAADAQQADGAEVGASPLRERAVGGAAQHDFGRHGRTDAREQLPPQPPLALPEDISGSMEERASDREARGLAATFAVGRGAVMRAVAFREVAR